MFLLFFFYISTHSATLAWHSAILREKQRVLCCYTTYQQLVDMVAVGIGPRLATNTRTEERALVQYNFLLSKEPFLTAPFFPKRSRSSSSSLSSSNSYSLDRRRLRPPRPCHGHRVEAARSSFPPWPHLALQSEPYHTTRRAPRIQRKLHFLGCFSVFSKHQGC